MRTRPLASLVVLLLAFALAARAGGPLYVAGTGFHPGLAGTPLTWAGRQISYSTDQGDLSPILRHPAADQLVADAFSRWTSVNTAAISVAYAGPLDEDVSGDNVVRAGAVLTMPADIQAGSAKPFAVVYDADGRVIEALLGAGAAAAESCASNAVIGGADRFTDDAHIAHALLIINGNCARTSTDLPLLGYALTRMIGRALGLDWSQLYDNVATGSPSPSFDDQAGFPLMHPQGSLCTVTYGCAYGADQLRMDDRAAISRLYPVTAENLEQFPGKTLFSASTARIGGRVLFPNWNATPGAGMQGANVVARWINPETGIPSRAVSASSVSGFLFRGNAGNPVTGFTGATGERFDRWVSGDTSLRGSYDLAGLEIPLGVDSAQYQLTVEPLNFAYTGALAVGPYKLSQVSPSGVAAPIVITVTRGAQITQDIVMQQSAADPLDAYEQQSFAQPGRIPGAGHWAAALSSYDDVDWHALTVRANRSFTFDITALDESGAATTHKALPAIGFWTPDAAESDPPLAAQTWLNVAGGITRLRATVASDGVYKLGVSDARGDGRPDFRYRARLLYADVTPTHAVAGTTLRITGIGFAAGMTVSIGGVDAPVLSYAVDELLVSAPALPDGTKDVTLTDPATGATAAIIGALNYGGGDGDRLQVLLASNPPVPVGLQAPNPFRIRVVAADGITPVAGASVMFTVSSASVSLLPCNTQTCIATSDGSGEVDMWILMNAPGAATVTASLANGATASATVSGVAGTLQISAVPPRTYVAAHTAASVPLLARVVGNGVLLAGRTVEFQVMLGAATLTSSSIETNSSGEARTTLSVVNLASEVRVSACVGAAPQIACDIFYVYPVAMIGGLQLLKAGGDGQYITAGQAFAPLAVRVFDTNVPPNAVAGVPVHFFVTAYAAAGTSSLQQAGEVITGHRAQPTVAYTSDVTVYSDGWGRASIAPDVPATSGALRVEIQASLTGGQAVAFTLHTLPATNSSSFDKPAAPRRAINEY